MPRGIPTHPSIRTFTVVLALMATSCEDASDSGARPGEEAAEPQIRDSAGIRIVENVRPADGSRLGWRISPEPVISIGTVEGGEDFQLYRVDDALKLQDGRIVVANGGSHQLLVFDSNGNYLTAWGQLGEGPGDFGGAYGSDGLGPPQLFWIEPWRGDSLAICHGTLTGGSHLLALWDDQGSHGRTVNLARGDVVSHCRDVVERAGIVASHQLTSSYPDPESPFEKGLRRSVQEFLIVEADGTPRASLGHHPGAEVFWNWGESLMESLIDGSSYLLMDPPFRKGLHWSAWGQHAIVAPTDSYEIRAYREDGGLARIVRRDHGARRPTQADLHDYRAGRASPNAPSNLVAALDALPLPESFPAFSAIEVDLLGNLWVREYNLPEDGDRALWTVFDPEGVVMGFVETPPGLIIYEIGEDYILGKWEDELRVEYVQLWGLDRAG